MVEMTHFRLCAFTTVLEEAVSLARNIIVKVASREKEHLNKKIKFGLFGNKPKQTKNCSFFNSIDKENHMLTSTDTNCF